MDDDFLYQVVVAKEAFGNGTAGRIVQRVVFVASIVVAVVIVGQRPRLCVVDGVDVCGLGTVNRPGGVWCLPWVFLEYKDSHFFWNRQGFA